MIARDRDRMGEASEAALRRAALIARLGSDPAALAAGRVLPEAPEARLDALLREIDETVLPRVLCVKVGTRDLARLSVSQRRLIGLDMPGRAAPRADPEALALVFAPRLLDIARTGADLTLSAQRRARAPEGVRTGCSVAALWQALAMAPTESAYERLLRLAEPLMQARLTWSDKPQHPLFEGQAAWQPTLVALADRLLKSRQGARGAARRSDGLLVPVTADLAVMVVTQGKQGCAALLPLAVALQLISAWQRG